jgi:hypothetical protein
MSRVGMERYVLRRAQDEVVAFSGGLGLVDGGTASPLATAILSPSTERGLEGETWTCSKGWVLGRGVGYRGLKPTASAA